MSTTGIRLLERGDDKDPLVFIPNSSKYNKVSVRYCDVERRIWVIFVTSYSMTDRGPRNGVESVPAPTIRKGLRDRGKSLELHISMVDP